MRTALATIALALSCVTLTVLVGCYPFDSPFVKACQAELKSRLRSPSGFTRISLSEHKEDISAKDFIENVLKHHQNLDSWVKNDLESNQRKPVKFTAFIEYDAPNAYGTLVRGTTMCEFYSDNGKFNDYEDFLVIVDGKDHFEHMLEIIKQLKQNGN